MDSNASLRRVLSWLDNLLLAAVVSAGGWFGYHQLAPDETRPPALEAPSEDPSARVGSDHEAIRLLATLEVKGRAPKTGYSRDQFGPRWSDVDRNGCDTRNDVLRRDLSEVALRERTNGCVVERGVLVDPYSGERIDFQKGNETSTLVQIDHVVPLLDAWQKGAQAWTADQRVRFANDPQNLLASSQGANAAKGAGDAATWLPPKKSFRCAYVARQVTVKADHGLWVTAAERDAIRRILATCPSQQ